MLSLAALSGQLLMLLEINVGLKDVIEDIKDFMRERGLSENPSGWELYRTAREIGLELLKREHSIEEAYFILDNMGLLFENDNMETPVFTKEELYVIAKKEGIKSHGMEINEEEEDTDLSSFLEGLEVEFDDPNHSRYYSPNMYVYKGEGAMKIVAEVSLYREIDNVEVEDDLISVMGWADDGRRAGFQIELNDMDSKFLKNLRNPVYFHDFIKSDGERDAIEIDIMECVEEEKFAEVQGDKAFLYLEDYKKIVNAGFDGDIYVFIEDSEGSKKSVRFRTEEDLTGDYCGIEKYKVNGRFMEITMKKVNKKRE